MSGPWMSRGSLAVLGTGAALPGPPLATEELVARLTARFPETPARLALATAKRLGIRTRHSSRAFITRVERPEPGASNPELAAAALSAALAQAGLRPDDLGYVIGHTATPAQPLPSNIALAADILGYSGPHLELRQACTGFANALMIAFGLLSRPDAQPVAIVGSETGSLFYDPEGEGGHDQIVNLVQMGDGAAAIILAPPRSSGPHVSAAWHGSAGLHRAPGLEVREGGSAFPAPSGPGPLAFHHDYAAIAACGLALFDAGAAAAAAHGIALGSVDAIIPHQVSGAIGGLLSRHFSLPQGRFFVNADHVGNTGSAAIWLALATLRQTSPAPGSTALVLGAEATKYMHGGFLYTH